MGVSWTKEAVATLARMWIAGKTASQISLELGVTRNAVIGKVHRLHLQRSAPSSETKQRLEMRSRGDGVFWDRANVEALRCMVEEKKSCSMIAIALKTTRSAVISKCHRLGLQLKCRPIGPRSATANAALLKAIVFAAPDALRLEVAKPGAAESEQARAPISAEAFPSGPVTILDLEDCRCCWPLGDPRREDFRYCGRPKPPKSGPYCVEHATVAKGHSPTRAERRAYRETRKPSGILGAYLA